MIKTRNVGQSALVLDRDLDLPPKKTTLDRRQNAVILLAVSLLTLIVMVRYHSEQAAILLVIGSLLFWILMETQAVTVFLHRFLTHGSWLPKRVNGWFVKMWLWWSRSGGVEFWVWVRNHRWHHHWADTFFDSYTPWIKNILTDQPPLKALHFWMNGVSYRKISNKLAEKPHLWTNLVKSDKVTRATQARLDELDWATATYGRLARANLINLVAFAILAVPMAWRAGGVVGLLLILVISPVMLGLKVVVYLIGGHIIDYCGHRRTDLFRHQSNIPWFLMLLTLFMMGEGWHEFHHDAEWSSRFHSYLDPGWWTINVSRWLGQVKQGSVHVARRVGKRQYRMEVAF